MRRINRLMKNLKTIFTTHRISALPGDEKEKISAPAHILQVLLIGNGSVFDDGIINLLSYRADLLMTHKKYLDDDSTLIEIDLHKPDLVVLLLSRSMHAEHLIKKLVSLVPKARLRLIVLSLETNQVKTFEEGISGEEIGSTIVTVLKPEDLIRIMLNNQRDGSQIRP